MYDIITLLVVGGLIFLVFNLFISLAPVLIPFILITYVINYFVRRKRIKDYQKQFQNYSQTQNTYYDNTSSQTNYDTTGNIRHDVIDVEYTETEEKINS